MSAPPLSDEKKKEILAAYEKAGNISAAARLLGIPRTTAQNRFHEANKDPSAHGLERYVPDGQKLRGVSTLYDVNGVPKQQWVKTKEDLDRTLEIIREAAEGFIEDIPKIKPTKFKGEANEELLCMYPLTDYHLGMMAKESESGDEWGTEKGVDFLLKWFATAIKSAPKSKKAVLWNGGDFFHYDSLDAVTPTSRHIMDTDTRYSSLVKAGVIALRSVVSMLLIKHEEVHIIMGEGNHDIASSVWLRLLFAQLYADEPRVTIDETDHPYYAYEFGKTALFFHHGHKQRVANASKLFAGKFREMFGRCPHSYAHMGDKHHKELKEDSLMIVEQHPMLAPKDAYSARNGYMANRSATVIIYSKEHGEVSRVTVRPEMVQ